MSGLPSVPSTSIEVNVVHNVSAQDLILITPDQLELILTKHLNEHQRSQEWEAPAGLFVGVVLVFCTSSFKEFLSVPASVWQALFMIAGAVFLYKTIRAAAKALKAPTIEGLMSRIKSYSSTKQP